MTPPEHPHLASLLAKSGEVAAEARRLRDTLTEEQLTWHPDEKAWSVADCFEHLRKVDKAYCRLIADALKRAKPATREPLKASFLARMWFAGVSPEPRFKVPALPSIVPKRIPAGEGAQTIDRFLDQQEEVRRLIREAASRDLNSGRFGSPIFPLLRLSIGEALTGTVLHEQRHTRQALRTAERGGWRIEEVVNGPAR